MTTLQSERTGRLMLFEASTHRWADPAFRDHQVDLMCRDLEAGLPEAGPAVIRDEVLAATESLARTARVTRFLPILIRRRALDALRAKVRGAGSTEPGLPAAATGGVPPTC